MRFEIKAGGWILILVGLAGLSLIVFALGLFAGYDMAHNTAPEATQAASVYPLPNPPPAPEVAKAPAAPPEQTLSAKAADKIKPSKANASSLAMDKDAGPVGNGPSRNVAPAAAAVAPSKLASSSDAPADEKP